MIITHFLTVITLDLAEITWRPVRTILVLIILLLIRLTVLGCLLAVAGLGLGLFAFAILGQPAAQTLRHTTSSSCNCRACQSRSGSPSCRPGIRGVAWKFHNLGNGSGRNGRLKWSITTSIRSIGKAIGSRLIWLPGTYRSKSVVLVDLA